jgi:hypothetical protein
MRSLLSISMTMQGRRLAQVSAECVCTFPYLLAVPLRVLNTKPVMAAALPCAAPCTKVLNHTKVPFSKTAARP